MERYDADYFREMNETAQESAQNTAEANFKLLEERIRKASFLMYVQYNALVEELDKAGYKSKAFDRAKDFLNNIR